VATQFENKSVFSKQNIHVPRLLKIRLLDDDDDWLTSVIVSNNDLAKSVQLL
jgi:hypothetical protein